MGQSQPHRIVRLASLRHRVVQHVCHYVKAPPPLSRSRSACATVRSALFIFWFSQNLHRLIAISRPPRRSTSSLPFVPFRFRFLPPKTNPLFTLFSSAIAMSSSTNPSTAGFVGSSAPPSLTGSGSVVAKSNNATSLITKLSTTTVPLTAAVPLVHVRGTPTASFTPTLAPSLTPQAQNSDTHAPAPAAGPNGTAIVLFRSDLRLDDHAALTRAVEQHATVIPLFCFDPRHFGRTPHGFDKTGKYRARFLIESVRALRDALRAKGCDLLVRLGRPEDVVVEVASKAGARSVLLHTEVTYEDQMVERELEKALKKRSVEMSCLWANTLYHRDDMPFPLSSMPDVYSDFREAVETQSKIQDPLPAPRELAPVPHHLEAGDIPSLADLGITDVSGPAAASPIARLQQQNHSVHSHGVSAVRGGEKEALARVSTYVVDARRMEARAKSGSSNNSPSNLVGADFSCRISPWLALGCVSPRRIFKEMKEASSTPNPLIRSGTYFELVWRDFFRCITAKYSEKRAAAAKNRSTVRSTSNGSQLTAF